MTLCFRARPVETSKRCSWHLSSIMLSLLKSESIHQHMLGQGAWHRSCGRHRCSRCGGHRSSRSSHATGFTHARVVDPQREATAWLQKSGSMLRWATSKSEKEGRLLSLNSGSLGSRDLCPTFSRPKQSSLVDRSRIKHLRLGRKNHWQCQNKQRDVHSPYTSKLLLGQRANMLLQGKPHQ